jgi:hypothetical protein
MDMAAAHVDNVLGLEGAGDLGDRRSLDAQGAPRQELLRQGEVVAAGAIVRLQRWLS